MTGASENPGMSAHKIRERKRLHLRINSGNKKLRMVTGVGLVYARSERLTER